MRVILLGLPGAGKGTQGQLLASKLGVPHVSIGDFVRDLVRKNTPLAEEIQLSWEQGQKWQPLPDDLSVRATQMALHGLTDFVLDGFPRNVAQAESAEFLEPVGLVIVLSIPDEESVKRILSRKRQDDSEEKARQRLAVERERLPPLIEYCRSRHQLIAVDGTQSVAEIHRQIVEAIR